MQYDCPPAALAAKRRSVGTNTDTGPRPARFRVSRSGKACMCFSGALIVSACDSGISARAFFRPTGKPCVQIRSVPAQAGLTPSTVCFVVLTRTRRTHPRSFAWLSAPGADAHMKKRFACSRHLRLRAQMLRTRTAPAGFSSHYCPGSTLCQLLASGPAAAFFMCGGGFPHLS